MTAPDVTSGKAKGHRLGADGAAYVCLGLVFTTWPIGQGKCECGELSPVLSTAAERKQWHRRHKQEVGGEG